MRVDFLSREPRLACPVHVPMTAPGRICTDTARGLSPLPLLVGLRERRWSLRGELHSQGSSLLRRASLLFPVNHAGLKFGAPGRILACNLRVRSAVLHTLSYGSLGRRVHIDRTEKVAAPDGFAPSTSRVRIGRSRCLSYRAIRSANRTCTDLASLPTMSVALYALAGL